MCQGYKILSHLSQVSGTVPNFFARETIGALEVKCPTQFEVNESNKRARGNEGEVVPTSDGCGWVGKCVDLGDHGKVCQFKLVTCEIEGCDHQCRRKDMKSHLSDDLIHHMKLMRDSADKKAESVKSECEKKIDSMNKKLKSMNKEIKALKKKVSELEAKQSQAILPSDDEEDADEGVKIKVEGCGIPEINGTYKQCDMHNPMFSKKGRWDGEDGEFLIYWSCFEWWIWWKHDGEFWQHHCHSEIQFCILTSKIVHLCTESRTYFYYVRTFRDNTDLPPCDGWRTTHQGFNPSPRITVLGNDNE
jgi:hypothetical protein